VCSVSWLFLLGCPVQVIDWKNSSPKWPSTRWWGTLNPTHSLTHSLGRITNKINSNQNHILRSDFKSKITCLKVKSKIKITFYAKKIKVKITPAITVKSNKLQLDMQRQSLIYNVKLILHTTTNPVVLQTIISSSVVTFIYDRHICQWALTAAGM